MAARSDAEVPEEKCCWGNRSSLKSSVTERLERFLGEFALGRRGDRVTPAGQAYTPRGAPNQLDWKSDRLLAAAGYILGIAGEIIGDQDRDEGGGDHENGHHIG